MLLNKLFRSGSLLFAVFAVVFSARAQQIVIDGVADRMTYIDSVAFRAQTNAGFTYEITLNGQPVPGGVFNTVMVMDYYDLLVRRTQVSDNSVTNVLLRFIVESSRRLDPEKGLIEWFPLPPTPSTAAEMAGAQLQVMTPQDYPAGLEIPVIARVEDDAGNERRVNGMVSAAGFETSAFRLLRGLGHGFLPPATPGSSISYSAQLQSLQTNKQINIEPSTTWTTVLGILPAATIWPPNSRIQVTGHLTIPAAATLTIGAGTVVRLNPGVNITNSGRTVINGTTTQPVVFTPSATNRVVPEQHTGIAWGGWIMRESSAQLIANAAIMTGAGAAASFSFSPGTSHKSDQPLLFIHTNATVRMTNCALINQAGQVGNGYFATIIWDHCLIQRAVTCGEYEACTNIVYHSAIIEFPAVDGIYDSTIAAADYDAFYVVKGTNWIANSLIGFSKDDAIDSGSGTDKTGSVLVANCWIESALHEALAWSGWGRQAWSYDSVLINCGQGIECGWSGAVNNSPLCYGGRLLSTANSVGARYGDNYSGTTGLGIKDGFLTVTNSIILHNYRDVWGQVWDNTWNYRVAKMDIHDNYLTAPNTNHPNNLIWNPATDASKIAAFMTTPTDAPVGIGIALWPNQLNLAMLTNGVPIRLSSFTTNQVSVDYAVQSLAGVIANGTLLFTPGETVRKIILPPASVQGLQIVRVELSNPLGGELTGTSRSYLVDLPSATTLIPFGASWRYLDDGSNQGTTWRNPGFNDSGWSNGLAQLGYGDNDEATKIRSNGVSGRIITTYFRKSIVVADPAAFGSLSMRLLRDDGGVVYLNGTEVFRSDSIPPQPAVITYTTLATNYNGGAAPPDNTIDTATLNAGLLQAGTNLLAVEIHQQSATSSDVSFDFELIGVPSATLFSARFGAELVLYWSDPAFHLECADSLPGNWTSVTGAVSPVAILLSAPQKFYRLKNP